MDTKGCKGAGGRSGEMNYPKKLEEIVSLFEHLPDEEKRESLVSYSLTTKNFEPKDGEKFDLEDVRKDEECADTVGVFLKVDAGGKANFRMTLGPQVQTLTKAMAAILCKGLGGVEPKEILALESDFVPKIVGAQLVRLRSQTTYYILSRLKGICKVWSDRERAKA